MNESESEPEPGISIINVLEFIEPYGEELLEGGGMFYPRLDFLYFLAIKGDLNSIKFIIETIKLPIYFHPKNDNEIYNYVYKLCKLERIDENIKNYLLGLRVGNLYYF